MSIQSFGGLSVLCAALALPSPAFADGPASSVADELSVGAGRSSPQLPRTDQVNDTLSAAFALSEDWTADLSVGGTMVGATKGVAGKEYGSRGGTSYLFAAGAIWEPGDHLTLGAELSFSPTSKLLADTTLSYAPSAGQAVATDALLSAKTASRAARLSASYDTAGGSSFETRFDLEGSYTHFDADQHVLATRDPSTGASVSDQQYIDYCRTTNTCSKQLLGLLADKPTPLDQTEVLVGILHTLYADTDLGLSGTYYFYSRDPTSLGFFGLLSRAGFQSGLPVAPLRWTVRPEAAHRFGDLTVKLWFQHGLYVDDEGTSDLLGVRLQYRLTRSFRIAVQGTAQRDRDVQGAVSTFDQASLGVTWLF